MNILVIDDDKNILSIIKETLEDTGKFRSIVTASDGVEGLRKSSIQAFDLIILDLQMPRMDGVETIGHIFKEKRIDPDKILVLSGNIDEGKLKRLASYGIRNFMVKPFSPDELIEKVEKLIEK